MLCSGRSPDSRLIATSRLPRLFTKPSGTFGSCSPLTVAGPSGIYTRFPFQLRLKSKRLSKNKYSVITNLTFILHLSNTLQITPYFLFICCLLMRKYINLLIIILFNVIFLKKFITEYFFAGACSTAFIENMDGIRILLSCFHVPMY